MYIGRNNTHKGYNVSDFQQSDRMMYIQMGFNYNFQERTLVTSTHFHFSHTLQNIYERIFCVAIIEGSDVAFQLASLNEECIDVI